MAGSMAKHLVIVESPAKAKTIAKFLGPDFDIKASFGHVRDLPDKKLGVDLKDHFKPTYAAMKDKAKVLKEIKDQAKKMETVYLATDPDREGEAIAWHIQEATGIADKKIQRIVFHEITKSAVQHAITNGRRLNMALVDAQQARRILDRLIGYKLSPILSKKIRRGLSAGRVQSVAVKMICDREKEILSFVPQEYWVIEALLQTGDKKTLKAKLFAQGEAKKKLEVSHEAQAQGIVTALEKAAFSIEDIKKTVSNRHPAPPFITSTLQQEASRKLNWTAKKTMMMAQQLYEGVEIDGEPVGLITYMRTDSFRISDEARAAAKILIKDRFGARYLPESDRFFKNKSAAQDAHEAIRPSYCDKVPAELKGKLSSDHWKLYKLIWDRFLASQMSSAQVENTSVTILAQSQEKHWLKTTGTVILFDGFLTLYMEGTDTEGEEEEGLLPASLQEKDPLTKKKVTSDQKFTQPPFRYTEATLVKEMEEKGIGRPSTYAPTLSVIQERGYVTKEKKNLHPSELGMLVNDKLEAFFHSIIDLHFTADMETQLDDIMDGKHPWQDVVGHFYTPFQELLKKADTEMEKIDNSRPSDELCEKCGSAMVIKAGRFGEFLACTHFPECKNTKSMAMAVEVPCPDCGKPIAERRSRKGKVFYSCSGYPDCKYATWDKPVAEDCPTCEAKVMFLKPAFRGRPERKYCAACTAAPEA